MQNPEILPHPALPDPNRGMRTSNIVAALVFLFLSGWTLTADLLHAGHFLLQPSFSSVALGIYVTAGMFVAILLAGFPKRILIPAIVLVTIRLSLGWPLIHWMDLRPACLLIDAGLALLAFLHLATSLKGRLFHGRPWFRWQHSVAMGFTAVISSVISLPAGFLGISQVIEKTSKGYVRITPAGIDLTERILEKDGRRVHLIGMAHVADGGFYDSLNASLAGEIEGRRLVLLEGVSDRENLLPESFASGETYRALAEKFGLSEQTRGFAVQSDREKGDGPSAREEWAGRGVDFLQADIDISELDPAHRERLIVLLKGMEKLDLASLLMMPEGIDAAALEDLIVNGLLGKRNERLMEVYADRADGYSEVFVPWGAAHLPDLERRFTDLGYRPVGEHRRRGIDFLASLRRLGTRS